MYLGDYKLVELVIVLTKFNEDIITYIVIY